MRGSALSQDVYGRLRCPICTARVEPAHGDFLCIAPDCGARFPIVSGVPVLINEGRSLFSLRDFVTRRDTTFHLQPSRTDKLLRRLLALLPGIGRSVGAERNYARFGALLLDQTPAPRILILGGSIVGEGMEVLTGNSAFELVATDVSWGPQTALICDAHDIPFDDESFDGVVIQAVLEHVVDPYRCVAEVHRVLKQNGLVYAETPFMQQVHMGAYDFTRFTHSGHRRLFRSFSEVASGPICGPGMALAWSYQYFLLSFTTSKVLRGLIRAFASVTAFYLKYFDRYLINKTAAIDAASGFYFMGRKDTSTLGDRDLISYYKGAVTT
jgi:SAM-dependent methyltransferase